ncbi:helix-turn-helix domain-containing protein [Streptomyces sp. NPDC058877]|uniref:helix-turn-helix domain-containing protein n=1 Tax=Streptomyces sp. NPDC058877 TaxID=3346665 RepID=UPI0036948318
MGNPTERSKGAAVEDLASRVRALKERDGRSYASLGRRLNVSASTLHRYGSGESVPEGFAVLDRLARLCGADGEERRALEAAWTRADRARLPAPPPAPTPPAAPPPAAAPGPSPAPPPAAPSTPPPPAPPSASSLPSPPSASAAKAPRPRRTATAVGVAVAVLAVVLALVAVLLDRPSRTPSGAAPTSVPEGRAVPEGEPVPFTWTVDPQLWQGGCGHTYLVDRAPRTVAPPPVAADAGAWVGAHRAVHGGEALVRITLQGRSPSTAVVLQALHVRVVDRAAPLPWNAYRTDAGCGGAVTPRHFAVDLDRPRPVARPVDGYDASGAEGRTIPAVSFPYAVTASEPEEFVVAARTAGCDCRWYLELEWSSGGRTGSTGITDDGKPFRTSGAKGRPTYAYDASEGRWITGAESGQEG